MDENIKNFMLQMADNSLILGHRLSEWCGHGPQLEQDIAMTNIALDLIGQSRLYYQYLGDQEGKTEDDYAFLRLERQYRNVLLVEYPNTDFAYSIIRSLFYDTLHSFMLEQLRNCDHQGLKNIATQAFNEVKYHLKFSQEWTYRLGDGTEVSHQKMQTAINDLWMYTGELFDMSPADEFMADRYQLDFKLMEKKWKQSISETLERATLTIPEKVVMQSGGKKGIHTEKLGFLLSQMQYLQRTYPNAQW